MTISSRVKEELVVLFFFCFWHQTATMIFCINLPKEHYSVLVISQFYVISLSLLSLFFCLVVWVFAIGEMFFFSPHLCFSSSSSNESKKKLESSELECERPKFWKKMEFNKG